MQFSKHLLLLFIIISLNFLILKSTQVSKQYIPFFEYMILGKL